ncbi:Glycosylphosphatidylinositol anchor biosynthesis protein 11 [Nakaseomyces bracarensis]|uniref:Glycosylphosphatidylinositol anchor biosynthesis protein 11 n=1 Tax=Nakaseomyces bracarensis TaxID=273131 RepID=A0ABR4NTV9_9SACH
MPVKQRTGRKHKSVSFSDDITQTQHHHKKKNDNHDRPPVFIRKTWLTIPWHLLVLVWVYIKVLPNYDTVKLLLCLVPCQILYTIFQLNKSTIYGNKRLKFKYSLAFFSLLACGLLSIPVLAIIILFGAPLLELIEETWLLALHCSYLAYPAVYSLFTCDFKVGIWKKYFIMIVVGCWISCVVIPLDWDRDWQAWPIPIVIGGYLGAFVGYSIGAYI